MNGAGKSDGHHVYGQDLSTDLGKATVLTAALYPESGRGCGMGAVVGGWEGKKKMNNVQSSPFSYFLRFKFLIKKNKNCLLIFKSF